MIEFFRSWCEGIIVAVIIAMLIEAILPEGNNKKYVKVVIGIYIIFTILNPLLGKLNHNVDFSNVIELPTVPTSAVNTDDIQELYANGIEQTLKTALQEEFEYVVKEIDITYDENYETIEKISLQVEEKGISQIETVEIGNQTPKKKDENEDSKYKEIKNYISENYDLDKNKILIN